MKDGARINDTEFPNETIRFAIKYLKFRGNFTDDNIILCATMERKQKLAGNLNSTDHLKLQLSPVLSRICCYDYFKQRLPP